MYVYIAKFFFFPSYLENSYRQEISISDPKELTHFDAITSLEAFNGNDDFPDHTNCCMYKNILSVTIGNQDVSTMLAHRVRLSCVRHLTAREKLNPTILLYLLTMMTRLESIHFEKGTADLLQVLGDPLTSLCLRDRALKRLRIGDPNALFDVDETDFSCFLGLFLHVFSDSLACLHWIDPSATISFEKLINALPNLKSLAIDWRLLQPPNENIVHWLESRTRRTTYVAKQSGDEGFYISKSWRIWL